MTDHFDTTNYVPAYFTFGFGDKSWSKSIMVDPNIDTLSLVRELASAASMTLREVEEDHRVIR